MATFIEIKTATGYKTAVNVDQIIRIFRREDGTATIHTTNKDVSIATTETYEEIVSMVKG